MVNRYLLRRLKKGYRFRLIDPYLTLQYNTLSYRIVKPTAEEFAFLLFPFLFFFFFLFCGK